MRQRIEAVLDNHVKKLGRERHCGRECPTLVVDLLTTCQPEREEAEKIVDQAIAGMTVLLPGPPGLYVDLPNRMKDIRKRLINGLHEAWASGTGRTERWCEHIRWGPRPTQEDGEFAWVLISDQSESHYKGVCCVPDSWGQCPITDCGTKRP